MKPTTSTKTTSKNGYRSDDENVRYKINTQYFNHVEKNNAKSILKKPDKDEDDGARYKFPTILNKPEKKSKHKQKIKVNFWSNKQPPRLNNTSEKDRSNRRHTVGIVEDNPIAKSKNSAVKVRKRVSFLPTPLFSENHAPMVTVPDDLTIQLNEEEANDLAEDLNLAFVNSNSNIVDKKETKKRSSTCSTTNSPKSSKRKKIIDNSEARIQGNENELEFFSKYVVQKLRRMETNQRIYSENLINTVLMLGQLRKLNGKSKIADI